MPAKLNVPIKRELQGQCKIDTQSRCKLETRTAIRDYELLLVALERLAQTKRHVDQRGIDQPVLIDRFGERNRDNVVAAQGNHAAKLAAMHHVDGSNAVTRSQHAIEGAGRSPALDVSEYDVAGLEAGAALDFASKDLSYAAEAHMAELVF